MTSTTTELPVGTHVRYWTGVREGAGKLSRTRTVVQPLGGPGGTPVVWVEGEGSCIAITHVQPVDVYPCQIGVFCDRCRTVDKGDYLVSDYDDKPARLSYARRHLAENKGWSCTDAGDFCPDCRASGPADNLLGTVRRKPNGTTLAVLWPSPPSAARWMTTDRWGSCGYETDEAVADWPVVGAVPYSPAAGMELTRPGT